MSAYTLQLNSALKIFSYLPVLLYCCFVLGSEGSLFTKKKSNSIAVADLYCREIAFQRASALPRHSYSLVSQILIHSRFLTNPSGLPTVKRLIIKCKDRSCNYMGSCLTVAI